MELEQGGNRDSSLELHGGGTGEHLVSRNGARLPLDDRFDASQYAFFGRDVAQEIEIGGLDEEDDAEHLEAAEEAFSLGYGGEAGEAGETYGIVSDMGDIGRRETDGSASDLGDVSERASSFMKLDRITPRSGEDETGPLGSAEIGPNRNDGEAPSQPHDLCPTSSWLDNTDQETGVEQETRKRWLNNQQQSMHGAAGDGPLGPSPHQAQQLKQNRWEADPSSVEAVPPTAAALYPSQRIQHGLQAPSSGHSQMMRAPLAGQYTQPYSSLQPPAGRMSSMKPYLANLPLQYSPLGHIVNPLVPPAQWLAQSNVQLAPAHGSGSQHFLQHAALMPPQVVLQYQRPLAPQLLAIPPQYPPNLKPEHMYNVTPPPPQSFLKMGENFMAGDCRDQSLHRIRQTQRHHQHGLVDGVFSGRNTHSHFWQPLRSKYMTVEEIENIVRIQWAATHSSDPYIDDYYHQALQTKLSAVPPHGRHHFAPSHLRDLPSHTRPAAEPHAYLQVDALGRVPFSSIRRPRPLLEVDSAAGSGRVSGASQGENLLDGVPQPKPLEQEPMLAARVAIEDGLCLLLDVDDVDRVLSVSQSPDGGAQLRRRRQLLLDELAATLQLVDSDGITNGGRTMTGRLIGPTCKDDLPFLRMVSLPKGQKLLTRYLLLLTPGSELVRIAGMVVFRHLRFLFGGVTSDPSSSAIAVGLANATALSVTSMDLLPLSACLATVVSAPEQPPLRPRGSAAGDGATVVLRSVLERATSLLTDRNIAYPMQNRAAWQASFDAFFTLLAEYCTNKYDSIFHSLMMAAPGNLVPINTAAAVEMSKEMPVELLRASLPHTNDYQRELLLEFAQRSIALSPLPQTGNEGQAQIAIVRG